MKNSFSFELVSPEERVMSCDVWQVVVPGDEGDIGVRAGHSSVLSSLRPGLLEIFSAKDEPSKKVFIAGGFADITGDNCTVLAEQTIGFEELDKDKVAKEVKDLSEDLSMAKSEVEKGRIESNLNIAKAKMVAIKGGYSN